jgi:metal-responsive CopG/Arc/MetJ family transcriptional regulator
MQRTQIYLEPDLAESLDRLAKARGTSRADLIRTAARRLVAEEQRPEDDPILGIIGLAGIGQDGATDVAEQHDAYLAEIVMEKWRR